MRRASTYTEQDFSEKDRLETQFLLDGIQDLSWIESIIKGKDADVSVLDIGCASGYATRSIFSGFSNVRHIVGCDRSQESIDEFNLKVPDSRFSGYVLDIEDDSAEKALRCIEDELGINSFDIAYLALSLHHMTDPVCVLDLCHRHLKTGGFCFVRTTDDSLKLAYPDESNLVSSILDETVRLEGTSDRFHGRKLAFQMEQVGFHDVRIATRHIDTLGKDAVERAAIFESAFSWRVNCFSKARDAARGEEERARGAEKLEWAKDTLLEIGEMFLDPSFYFALETVIGIGKA